MSSPNDPKAGHAQDGQAPQYPWANPSGQSATPGGDNAAARPSYGLPGPAPAGSPVPSPERAAAQRALPEADQFMPLRPLGLGDILSCGVRFSRIKPKVVFGVSLLFYSLAFLISTMVVSITAPRYLASSFNVALNERPGASQTAPEGYLEYMLGMFSSSLVTIITTMLLVTAMVPLVHAAVTARELSFSTAMASLRKHWLQMLLFTLLFSLIFTIGTASVIGIAVGVGVLLRESVAAVVTIFLLGCLLTLALMVFIFTRTLFAPYVLVLEDRSAVSALKRSWQLTSGRTFWRVAGIGTLIAIICNMLQQVLAILPGVVVGILMAVLFLAFPEHPYVTGAISMALILVISFLVVALTQPLMVSTYTALFYDTKIRREGYDMQLQQELSESRD